MPVKVSFSPSVKVSPMLMVPWLCRPMMSPAKASSAAWRSAAMKVSASAMRISLSSRTWYMRMPRLYLPEHRRMKAMRSRCCGSMFAWILNTKPVSLPSVASTSRCTASCLQRRGRVRARNAPAAPRRRNSRWPSRRTPASVCPRDSRSRRTPRCRRAPARSRRRSARRDRRGTRALPRCAVPGSRDCVPRSPRPAASYA